MGLFAGTRRAERGPTARAGVMRSMKYVPPMLVQAVWGFPQTLAGLAVFAAYRDRPHFPYHGAVVTLWGRPYRSMSLGPFLFVEGDLEGFKNPEAPDHEKLQRILVHEYGHTVQSLMLGPLYLPLVGLPSVVWANAPRLKARRHRLASSYYAFWPERNANWFGEHVLKRPSMGQAVID